jgi:metabolite-proton symporter
MSSPEAEPLRGASLAKVVGTSLAATSIEWYDFFIYGTAAALIFPQIFFSADLPPAVAQLAAFSTFAVGFIARPVGGVVFGYFGDKLGRKKALVAALLLMGLSTTLIGCLPTYAHIGVLAPLALIVLRFLQGLAVGGQWGGAALMVVENAPPERRGYYGSFPQLGVPVGVILANGVFLIMAETLSPGAFVAWGWRVPFLISVLLVGLGLYVQLKMEDTPEFRALAATEEKVASAVKAVRSHNPILDAIRKHPKEILLAAGSFVASNGCFYILITYVVSYATAHLGLARATVLQAVLIGAAAIAVLTPIAGAASDRFGRRGVYMTGAVLMAIWSFVFWDLVNTAQFFPLVVAISVGLALQGLMYGPQSALFAELFSIEVRYSGASMGYQLGAILGGGFAPIIAGELLRRYDSTTPIAIYMAILCAVSFVSVFLLSETNKRGKA